MIKRIIFVDDEVMILQALERMLTALSNDWDMTFVESGEKALEIMDKEPQFHVVVSDIRMPGMDGLEFLSEVRKRHPHTVRFALSGHTDSKVLFKASSITHQFLSKPCEPQVLHNLIARAFALRDHLDDGDLKQTLHDMGALPSLPALYKEIMDEITSIKPSLERISAIIQQDVSMSAKLLQIVNSAFVQPGMHISNVHQAVNLLGIDNVKNLVLMVEVVSPLKSAFNTDDFGFDQLWEHSMTVARYAMTISQSESDDEKVAYDAFTAGLLHDVGKLILATKMPEKLHQAFMLARENSISLFQAEKEIFGATHAQVGGYLLELWGLPDPIVEAITWHDYPSLCPEDAYATTNRTGFSTLTAVHVANYFCEDDEFAEAEVDHVHLNMLGLTDRMEDWLNLCFNA